jgi:hypothetical protein
MSKEEYAHITYDLTLRSPAISAIESRADLLLRNGCGYRQ